ncbi:MAG: LysR family transcriptional regulator [Saprospiraceae bacterium]|nr:LysR family transcriptional regulator [Saprospiraceae bacterium]
MNYTLNQLRIFLSIAQNESITKAAEELHLTQPAVSIQLKNFQQQFDIPLTEVIHKKLYITDFGREIAEAAENILNEVYAINYKTMAYKGQLAGRLKISVVSTGKYIIPYFLSDFMKMNKGVEISLDVTNRSKVLESLNNNEIDFALTSTDPGLNGVIEFEIMENYLCLVANSTFTDTGEEVMIEDLLKLPMIYRELGSGTRMVMEQFLSTNVLQVAKKIQLTSNEAVKQAILAGLGLSIMPIVGMKNELMLNQFKIIPVQGLPIKNKWRLLWLQNKRLSPVAKAYLHFLKSEKERIVSDKFSWVNKYINN